MKYECKLLTTTAKPPQRAKDGDIGYDVFADLKDGIDIHIFSGARKKVHLGFCGHPQNGIYPHIMPRSGHGWDYGIQILGGIIDPGYTGELIAMLHNSGVEPFRIKQGMKVAQIVFLHVATPEIVLVDSLEETARGASGFGSTGNG